MPIINPDEELILEQKKLFRGKHTFTIIGDGLEYSGKWVFSLNKFTIPLRDLNPKPSRYQNIPVGWFLLLAITLLMSILMITVAITSTDKMSAQGCEVVGIICILFTAYVTRKISTQWTNIWLFQGQGNYLPIWANKPNKKEVEKFVMSLSERIKRYQGENKQERNFLDFLRNEGLIDEWNYDKAAKLLDGGKN